MERKQDSLDRLVIFLAKRDGIDKLVKTFQYVSKLCHWQLQGRKEAAALEVAARAKSLELATGLARKAFRLGRWLSGLNAMRSKQPNAFFGILAIFANAGEMVYFFFDHFTWLSRIGVLDKSLASKFSFVSASGEAFGYIFFVTMDLIFIVQGILGEHKLLREIKLLQGSRISKEAAEQEKLEQQIRAKTSAVTSIRMKRVMQTMAIAANVADFVIALADIQPSPFVTHSVTLGISGLISAWAGWYRNWPSSE